MLTEQDASEILIRAGLQGIPATTLYKEHNHVYLLQLDDTVMYLKTYTKDWYGDDVAATGYCVNHENSAWQIMANAGLAVPIVLDADETCDNPLERPYILTEALQGASLTSLDLQADREIAKSVLNAVGAYLRHMHDIEFPYPGYVTRAGFTEPPAPDQWQHRIWTFERFDQESAQIWDVDDNQVPAQIMTGIRAFYAQHRAALQVAYQPPRLTHGDCHASQFFMYQEDGKWRVSGVVDMEVTSAGDCGADFFQFTVEMAAHLPVSTQWWQPLFEGYGREPNFQLLKLRMLAAHHQSYAWVWPGARAQILEHILQADDWEMLFDLAHLRLADHQASA